MINTIPADILCNQQVVPKKLCNRQTSVCYSQRIQTLHPHLSLISRQMMDHYANMLPQLIRNPKILGPVQSFMA